VSKKSAKIAVMIDSFRGRPQDPHYLAYFECFNTGLYYEAHDVLEELWLTDKHGPSGNFYKGLIQLAGAFVHMQQHNAPRPRLRPAARLLRMARANLAAYTETFEQLNVSEVLGLIDEWLERLERLEFQANPLTPPFAPTLRAPGR
jgi:hypothetical protein